MIANPHQPLVAGRIFLLFTAPKFLRYGRRRNDLLNPVFRGIIQTAGGTKNAPRSCQRKASAKEGERFWPYFQPQNGVEYMETALSKSGGKQMKWSGNGQKQANVMQKIF